MGIQWLMVGMTGGFQLVMGVPPMLDFHGKIPFSKVDDDWGYPHFPSCETSKWMMKPSPDEAFHFFGIQCMEPSRFCRRKCMIISHNHQHGYYQKNSLQSSISCCTSTNINITVTCYNHKWTPSICNPWSFQSTISKSCKVGLLTLDSHGNRPPFCSML